MPLELVDTLTGHSDRVWTLAWNPTGTTLASSGGDKRIRLWSMEGNHWQCVAILDDTHEKSIRRLCWSPCGNYIASASFDSTVSVWKLSANDKSWKNLYNLDGHSSEVKSVAWSSDGQFLATCGRDKAVWIWERASNVETTANQGDENEDDIAESWDCSDVKADHSKDVKNVVWHPKANILISCSYDDTAKLFHKDGDDWKCYQTLSTHTSTVWSADFSASGEFLVTCSDDKTVRVCKNHAHSRLPNVEANSWKCVSVIQGYHTRTIYDVSWNKKTDVIASASGDNSLIFYRKTKDDASDTPQDDIFVCIDKYAESHNSDVNVVAWNPEKPNILATGGDDRSIKIWFYDIPQKGMEKPITVVEEIICNLKAAGFGSENEMVAEDAKIHTSNSQQSMSMIISDFTTLLTTIQSLQNLQNQLNPDSQTMRSLEHLFDLKLSREFNPEGVGIKGLLLDDKEGYVKGFDINIIDNNGEIKFVFKFNFEVNKFKLILPKRSVKFLVVAENLFLLEKTGDMFKILPSGTSEFLLGHLFAFSDVKFLVDNKQRDLEDDRCAIEYIISADRDEKIRVSNYPKTFNIECYCFGHRSFIKRLFIVDEKKKFISIDQENNAMLWNLSDLSKRTMNNNSPIKPEASKSLLGNESKRLKT